MSFLTWPSRFQSTLPRGSDYSDIQHISLDNHFNPRSLAGATSLLSKVLQVQALFQSTLPRGSDRRRHRRRPTGAISIHAPSRERPPALSIVAMALPFQSTLPRGSDCVGHIDKHHCRNFNPRSLAGATLRLASLGAIFADFNPRSLAGATAKKNAILFRKLISIHAPSRERRLFVLAFLYIS